MIKSIKYLYINHKVVLDRCNNKYVILKKTLKVLKKT